MLKAKTKLYPWECFSCEKIYESNVEAAIIWDTTEGKRLHGCKACEDDIHIDNIPCEICGVETKVVYTLEHEEFTCDCGHVQDLWQEDEDDDEEP